MSTGAYEAKKRHMESAEEALSRDDYESAATNIMIAARHTLDLADAADGQLRQERINEANNLMELAERSRRKVGALRPQRQRDTHSGLAPSDDDESAGSKGESWMLSELPDVRLSDIAGLDDVKEKISRRIIKPFEFPELYEKYNKKAGGGVLMFGPPGTGKTLIASAIAGELGIPFFSAEADRIVDKYVGETRKNLRSLFDEARQFPRSVIFIDEVDGLLDDRGDAKSNAVEQFLVETDGLRAKSSSGLLLIGATNRPWKIDTRVFRKGRFEAQVWVGLPDETARRQIVRNSLEGVPVDESFSFEQAAELTDGFSGADVGFVCEEAKQRAIDRDLETGEIGSGISHKDFQDSVTEHTPRMSKEEYERLKEWGGVEVSG